MLDVFCSKGRYFPTLLCSDVVVWGYSPVLFCYVSLYSLSLLLLNRWLFSCKMSFTSWQIGHAFDNNCRVVIELSYLLRTSCTWVYLMKIARFAWNYQHVIYCSFQRLTSGFLMWSVDGFNVHHSWFSMKKAVADFQNMKASLQQHQTIVWRLEFITSVVPQATKSTM